MSDQSLPPSLRINQLYWGFAISRAIHVAAKLKLADNVPSTGITSDDLASKLSLNPDRLYRLMRLLASYEIFEETDKYTFKPTPLSDAINSATKDNVQSAAHLVTKSMWEAYGHIEHSIRTGNDTYSDLFGKNVFEYLNDHPDESEEFDNAMHNYAELENPPIAQTCQLENKTTIADIGGGQGGFLKEVLTHHKHIKGTLFDQPHVISDAIIPGNDQDLAQRTTIVGGSFFEPIQITADVYVLKRILHDWSNEDCCKILSSIKSAMTKDSRLFIIEAIVPGGNVPHFSKDLEAFLITWGGQERDRAEFETLLDNVGMSIVSIKETPSLLSIIEAKIN